MFQYEVMLTSWLELKLEPSSFLENTMKFQFNDVLSGKNLLNQPLFGQSKINKQFLSGSDIDIDHRAERPVWENRIKEVDFTIELS